MGMHPHVRTETTEHAARGHDAVPQWSQCTPRDVHKHNFGSDSDAFDTVTVTDTTHALNAQADCDSETAGSGHRAHAQPHQSQPRVHRVRETHRLPFAWALIALCRLGPPAWVGDKYDKNQVE